MDDVHHHVDAEVAADRALVGLLGIGRSDDGPDIVDRIVRREGQGHNGGRGHESLQFGKERL